MSNGFFQGGAVAETYVSIRPQVDTAEFQSEVEAQVHASIAEELSVPVKANLDVADLQRQKEAAEAEFAAASQRSSMVSAQNVIGQATIAERTAALGAMEVAAIKAAKADVALFTATGEASVTLASNIAFLEKATKAELEYAASVNVATGAETRQSREGRTRLTTRSLIEEGAAGRIGVGALARGIPQVAAAVVAFEAFQKISEKVTDALKVEGDAAYTTEGKFRNLGAALIHGDVVGGLEAIAKDAPTATKQLNDLLKSGQATAPALDLLGDKAVKSASEMRESAKASIELNGELTFAAAAALKMADDADKAADRSHALAAAFRESEQAANDVATAIRNAGSEAARFGEKGGAEGRGPGGIDRGQPFSTGTTTDATNTDATANAVAESLAARKQGLARLRAEEKVARDEENQILARNRNERGDPQGAAQRRAEAVAATTKRIQAEQAVAAEEKRIRDAADAEAKKNADDAARAAEKRKRDREEAARQRAQELRDTLDYREQVLQDALTEAQATENSVKDDRAALRKLIAFEHEKSQNRALTLSEREKAAQAEREYRRQLNDVNKTQLANALQVREQNLRNAIEAAKLTTGTADDDKANADFLRFLQNNVKRAKGNALAVAQAKGEVIAFKQSLQGGNAGGGFTLNDLFKTAADQQETFGSNIGARNASLSGQDERAAFGAAIIGNRDRTAARQLTVSERMAATLDSIDRKIGRGGAPVVAGKGKKGNLQAIYGAEIAAAYGYGVN